LIIRLSFDVRSENNSGTIEPATRLDVIVGEKKYTYTTTGTREANHN